jgi:hypothetical protein
MKVCGVGMEKKEVERQQEESALMSKPNLSGGNLFLFGWQLGKMRWKEVLWLLDEAFLTCAT